MAAVGGHETEYVEPATATMHFSQSAATGEEYSEDMGTVNCLTDAVFLHQVIVSTRPRKFRNADVHTYGLLPTMGIYQGILPDSGAAEASTCGMGQYLALKAETAREDND